MIQINKNPSRTDLLWFGLLLATLFALAAAMVLRRFQSVRSAQIIWIASALLVSLYYLIPPVRRPVYVGSIYLTYPLGWVMSHLILMAMFYLVITPLGLLMRLSGRDPMTRRFDSCRQSYWVEHDPSASTDRYFRQS